MRYRLTKAQAEMLIEGGALTAGARVIRATDEAKDDLKKWIDLGCPFGIVVDTDTNEFRGECE